MSKLVLLRNYNNYYNRIIKHDALADIKTNYTYKEIDNINFNPNDGLYTNQVVNWSETWTPDYLLIVENTTLDSRWFILEWKRNRKGQYEAILKRDVIADNYQSVLDATTYVEKATITSVNDPMIYNKEGLAVNQIKQSETFLKDETQCGWVVGYIPQDAFPTAQTVVTDAVINASQANITVNGLSNWSYWKNTTTNANYKYMSNQNAANKVALYVKSSDTDFGGTDPDIYYSLLKLYLNTSSGYLESEVVEVYSPGSYVNPPWWDSYNINAGSHTNAGYDLSTTEKQSFCSAFTGSTTATYVNAVIGSTIEMATTSQVNQLLALRSQIIKDTSTGLYYRIDIKEISTSNPIVPNPQTTAGTNLVNHLNSCYSTYKASHSSWTGSVASTDVQVALTYPAYAIELNQVSIQAGVTVSGKDDRYHLSDNPYDMFCIPYSDELRIYDGVTTFTCTKGVALALAENIAGTAGSSTIYDVQLLPYCPARHIISGSASGTTLDVTKGKYDIVYQYNSGQASSTKLSCIMWCMSSSFQVPINVTLSVPPRAGENHILNRKLSNELDLYRLCSPNYNGVFEFSVAKSNGQINGFMAECTYKPYNPYIHVTPKLSGLYGDNYIGIDDMRGLICGGDFSLPQLSNQWANYELSNKNYQKIFDRQMQNLDVQYDVARQEALAQTIAGGFTGTASGAAAGAMSGGGWVGAIVGGVVGGASSVTGGVMDYQNLTKLQNENRDFQTDLYNYNLQNIKAIPSSLTKSSALTFNTRIWPFVEYYTCTQQEQTALIRKLTYNGMTIMRIDNLSNFKQSSATFMKGQIIRINNVDGESGLAAEIQSEISKGVFI